MEHNGQGAEDQVPTSQSSGPAGTAPMDIQKEVPRRVSFATYRRHSSTVDPQEENIPGDPVAFRNEDYLSRPSWLFDIGRYPVTLCPHIGSDGVPQKTPSGTPIYATEERHVRKLSWLIDTSQHAHIVHYGTRRRSSTGAPYFVTADQAGHRPSEFSDSGKFSFVPSVSTAEGRGRRKSFLAFATEDGHLHSPSWLDNTEKYRAITGPQRPGGGAPRRSSVRAPVSGAQEEHLHRPSQVSQKHTTHPRPQKDYGRPGKKSTGVLISPAQEDDHPPKLPLKNLVYSSWEMVTPHTHPSFEELHQLHTDTSVPSCYHLETMGDLRRSPGAHRLQTVTMPPQTFENIAPQKAGELPRPASPRPLIEGRDTGNLASRKYSAARETKARKGQVSSEVTKSMQFDLSHPRDQRPPATRHKATAEENPHLRAHSHTKKGHQDKQLKTSPHPITATTQTQKGKGFIPLTTVWTATSTTSLRVEGKVVRSTTTKTSSSAGVVKLDRSSSKVSKKITSELIANKAEDQAPEHLSDRDAATELKWGKASSPIKLGPKTSNLQTAKGGTSRTQATQATWGVTVLKQDRKTLLRKSMQESESPQPAAATAMETQDAGIHSTVDKATGGTKITGQTTSPIKVVRKSTHFLSAKPKKLAPTTVISENKYSSKAKTLSAARNNLETTEPTALKNDSKRKYVYQNLHVGRIKLLPLMYNPEEAKQRKNTKCDLQISGFAINYLHSQVNKPKK